MSKQAFKISNVDELKKLYNKMAITLATGKILYLEISFWIDTISRNQQCYYFGVILPTILDYFKEVNTDLINTTVEELDNYMRNAFYSEIKVNPVNNETTKLNKRLCWGKAKKDEVIAYFNQLIAYADNLGIKIPTPQERGFDYEKS